jgi:hypothetical protein
LRRASLDAALDFAIIAPRSDEAEKPVKSAGITSQSEMKRFAMES